MCSYIFQLNLTSLTSDILENTDIHIHFPAGAVGKDGPSAGVTVVTVLTSLFTGRCVRSDTAMTGEITLRGLVLPVCWSYLLDTGMFLANIGNACQCGACTYM